jgi:NACalpha-BTF3-like transcription factor
MQHLLQQVVEAELSLKKAHAESKMRDALLTHGLTPLDNVATVFIRNSEHVQWTFQKPSVFVRGDVYFVFGNPTIQNSTGQIIEIRESPEFIREPGDMEELSPAVELLVEEDLPRVILQTRDEENCRFREEDIAAIITHAKATREIAIGALSESMGDLVSAVIRLML